MTFVTKFTDDFLGKLAGEELAQLLEYISEEDGVGALAARMERGMSLTADADERQAGSDDPVDMPPPRSTRQNGKQKAPARSTRRTVSGREEPSHTESNPAPPAPPPPPPPPGALRTEIPGPVTPIHGVVCMSCLEHPERCAWRPPLEHILTSCEACLEDGRQCELAYYTADSEQVVMHETEELNMQFVFENGWAGLKRGTYEIVNELRRMNYAQMRLAESMAKFFEVYRQWLPLYNAYISAREPIEYSAGEHIIGGVRVIFAEPTEETETSTPAASKFEKVETEE